MRNTHAKIVCCCLLLSWKLKMNFLSKQQSLWEMIQDCRYARIWDSCRIQNHTKSDFLYYTYLASHSWFWFRDFNTARLLVNQNNLGVHKEFKISKKKKINWGLFSWNGSTTENNFFDELYYTFPCIFNEFLCLW